MVPPHAVRCAKHNSYKCGCNSNGGPPSSTTSQNSASQSGFSTRVEQRIRNEELGSAKKGSTGSSLVPSSTNDDSPEVEQLLELHKANRFEPVSVELPPLPDSATEPMREVADFFELVHGLRLYAGMDPEVPFASGWVADKIEHSKTTVYRALKDLEAAGVLRRAGKMPGRDGKRGTHLWLPGGGS